MNELSAREIFDIINKNKLLILGLTTLFILIGLIISATNEKVYTASSSVIQNPDSALVTDRMSQSQGIERILDIGSSSSDQSEVYIEIMHSHEFLEYFFKKRNILDLIFSMNEEVSDNNSANINEAARNWKNNIFDFDLGKKSIIKIHVTYKDSHLAKIWLDQFIEDFNEFIANKTKSDLVLTSNYLEETLESTKSESTREALNFLLIEQQRKLALASSIPEFALKTISPTTQPDLPSNTPTFVVTILSFVFGLVASFIVILIRLVFKD